MLNKNKSKQVLKFKYILLLPLLVGMLMYSSCEKQDEITIKKGNSKDDTIDYSDAQEIPFVALEEVPIFPGIKIEENSKELFRNELRKFVNREFNTSLINDLELETGKTRVYIQFIIDKNGKIKSARARAPHKALEEEALRVINSLSVIIPGKYNGKKVATKYTLPITLMISDENNDKNEANTSFKDPDAEFLRLRKTSKKKGYIYGVVSNESKPLPGVNITIKGTNRVTVTNFDGNFKIKATKGEELVFDFIGKPKRRLKINETNIYKVVL